MRYFVTADPQAGNGHEIHTSTCPRLPYEDDRVFLGDFATCGQAIVEARKLYRRSTGCSSCSPGCHAT